jgi:hypothetical protein
VAASALVAGSPAVVSVAEVVAPFESRTQHLAFNVQLFHRKIKAANWLAVFQSPYSVSFWSSQYFRHSPHQRNH